MTWLLPLLGALASLWGAFQGADRYYQGMCYGMAIGFGLSMVNNIVNRTTFNGLHLLIAAAGVAVAFFRPAIFNLPEIKVPLVKVPNEKRKPLLPKLRGDEAGKFIEGDAVSPFNGAEVTCDLPPENRMKNTGGNDRSRRNPNGEPGKGSGLCVFTSIEHAARWQAEERLYGLQKEMTNEPGGGYPGKVDAMIKKYGADTQYVQHTGGDESFLELALKTGRMPGVTYAGRDPRYNGETIAHMVNLVYLDAEQAAILDNNFPTKILWMTRKEFLDRWRDQGGGWAVVLLNPPAAPVAAN